MKITKIIIILLGILVALILIFLYERKQAEYKVVGNFSIPEDTSINVVYDHNIEDVRYDGKIN